ncbi:MAG: SUMF1/EgtB/PvdO family nonheme iron enzyme, partial [Planctomycetia bacterium]|nr:SUMF1/EgtB/PvdO family nonheme iron enzyme [Planctomycetia bacterium]
MKKTLILLVLLMVPCLLFAAYVFMITPQGHSPSPFQNLSEEDQKYVTDGREKRAQEEIDPDLVLVSEATGVPSEGRTAGERLVKTINGVEYAFRWCPAGEFMMGSPEAEFNEAMDIIEDDLGVDLRDFGYKETPHRVTLTQGFWMLETEVTVGMYRSFVKATGHKSKGQAPFVFKPNGTWEQDSSCSWSNPGFSQTDKHPVTCVCWEDARAFCEWLRRESGLSIQLPTEAQWEYACRAGTTTRFFWGDKEADGEGYLQAANEAGAPYGRKWDRCFPFNTGYTTTAPVGSFKPNPWGLYDMHGNVWEWCSDWYDSGYYDRS